MARAQPQQLGAGVPRRPHDPDLGHAHDHTTGCMTMRAAVSRQSENL
jgi:hypothetical protein